MKINYKSIREAFYIGLTGFGGPAILGIIKNIMVEKDKRITEDEYYQGLSLSQITPGPPAGNILIYISKLRDNDLNAFLVYTAFLLPCVISMIILSAVYYMYGSVPFVKDSFYGLHIAVVVLLIFTLQKVVLPLAKNKVNIFIILSAFLLRHLFNMNLMYLLILLTPFYAVFSKVDTKPQNTNSKFPVFHFIMLAVSLLTVILLGFVPDKAVTFFSHMGKIGFVLFGGGYATLPVIHEITVNTIKWLNTKEFMDGMALAQVTPGPILNIAVFIGYKIAGVWGALLGGLGMFLPAYFLMTFVVEISGFITKHSIFMKISRGVVIVFSGILIHTAYTFFMETVTDIKALIFFVIIALFQFGLKLPTLAIIAISILLPISAGFIGIK